MKAILFGASGMVGQGVLRECLANDAVESVLLVGRSPSGVTHSKVHELVQADLYDYVNVAQELSGYDACFFCLGVSAG
jgi:putative NADH-flavin reductase